MPFCTYCGKPLQEGEVCSCRTAAQPAAPATPATSVTQPVPPVQSIVTDEKDSVVAARESAATAQETAAPVQESVPVSPAQATIIPQPAQPNAFVIFFKLLWETVIGIIKTPVTSIAAFVEKADVKLVGALIVIQALVDALIRWFGLLQTKSYSTGNLNDWMNQIYGSGGSAYTKNSAGYIFKQMCCSALFVIAGAAVVALVIMISVNAMSKVKITYIQGLAIASLTSILLIPSVIIAYLFGLFGVVFFTKLGEWVTTFASAAGAIYIFLGIRVLCKDENKIPLIAGLCAVGSAIAIYLINMMF